MSEIKKRTAISQEDLGSLLRKLESVGEAGEKLRRGERREVIRKFFLFRDKFISDEIDGGSYRSLLNSLIIGYEKPIRQVALNQARRILNRSDLDEDDFENFEENIVEDLESVGRIAIYEAIEHQRYGDVVRVRDWDQYFRTCIRNGVEKYVSSKTFQDSGLASLEDADDIPIEEGYLVDQIRLEDEEDIRSKLSKILCVAGNARRIQVVKLRYGIGSRPHSDEEICRKLQITEVNCRSHISRGLKSLRKAYQSIKN